MSVFSKIPRVMLCLLLCSLALPTCMAQQTPTTVVKVFRIQYAEPAEISAAVQGLLSEVGSITVQPAQRRITVRDRSEQMAHIAKVVAEMDVQPKNFRIQVTLLHGSASLPKGEQAYPVSSRLQKMFPFKAYGELGRAELQGKTGDTLDVKLNEKYSLMLTALDYRQQDLPFGISNDIVRLELRPVILQSVADGRQPREILRTRVVISENQELSIGAGISESAHEGLVLVLKALPPGRS